MLEPEPRELGILGPEDVITLLESLRHSANLEVAVHQYEAVPHQ
jgi:hypothetical protein